MSVVLIAVQIISPNVKTTFRCLIVVRIVEVLQRQIRYNFRGIQIASSQMVDVHVSVGDFKKRHFFYPGFQGTWNYPEECMVPLSQNQGSLDER